MSRSFQSGIPTDLFIHDISAEYKCSICTEVLNDPVQCRAGHMFCRHCVSVWLQNHVNCPECRIDLSIDSLSDARLIRNFISELQVRCKTILDTEIHDCEWTGQLNQLDNHMITCDRRPVVCPFSNKGTNNESVETPTKVSSNPDDDDDDDGVNAFY
jgi:hypothetical protein